MTERKNLVLKTQRNDLLKAMKNRGLNPTEFVWKVQESLKTVEMNVSRLVHEPTDYYYLFDFNQGGCWCEYSPGQDTNVVRDNPGFWERQYQYALNWLDYLKREIEAPDLWATIAEEKAIVLAASAEEIENNPFTPEEQKQITVHLNEIKQYLAQTQELKEQQADFANRRFDYLADAATRMGRKDWLNLAVGVITGVIIQLTFQPGFIHELWQFIANIFKPFLGGILPPQ